MIAVLFCNKDMISFEKLAMIRLYRIVIKQIIISLISQIHFRFFSKLMMMSNIWVFHCVVAQFFPCMTWVSFLKVLRTYFFFNFSIARKNIMLEVEPEMLFIDFFAF